MAGEGSRFAVQGWKTPKPLIQLNGKPLFLHALDSVKGLSVPKRISLIVRQEHIDKYAIDQTIRRNVPCATIYAIETTTRGAVETCMVATSGIDNEDGILVMDCDLKFSSKSFEALITTSLSQTADESIGGALVSFESNNPRYSFAEVENDGISVVRTAEKEVISTHALCGAYYFGSGEKFKLAAKELLSKNNFDKPEFYVSLLYNILLSKRERVMLASVDKYCSFGTPEELKSVLI